MKYETNVRATTKIELSLVLGLVTGMFRFPKTRRRLTPPTRHPALWSLLRGIRGLVAVRTFLLISRRPRVLGAEG